MKFGLWYPIAEAAQQAPERPGVLQVRAEDLLDYPAGRSAMIFYDATANDVTLRAHVTGAGSSALRKAEAAGGRWIRFAEAEAPKDECGRLLSSFVERFGTPPVRNGGGNVRIERPTDR